jgi:hypothetical protein
VSESPERNVHDDHDDRDGKQTHRFAATEHKDQNKSAPEKKDGCQNRKQELAEEFSQQLP